MKFGKSSTSLLAAGVIAVFAAIASSAGAESVGGYEMPFAPTNARNLYSPSPFPVFPSLDFNRLFLKEQVRLNPSSGQLQLTHTPVDSRHGYSTFIGLDDFAVRGLKGRFMELYNLPRVASIAEDQGSRAGGRRALTIDVPIKFPKIISRFTGEGSSISVSGNRRISFSGRSEWTEGQVATAASRASKFPSLNMQQDSRFTVEGTVGDRISVQIDQDSHKQSDLENNIKISYNGDEDGVVQKIEAGNTSLTLPGTRFVGFSAQHKGLFGIRSEGKLGGVDLTVIASQEKSSGQRSQFKGQSQESSEKIRDYEYKQNTYFFLDSRYRDRFRDIRDAGVEYSRADSIAELRVYVDDLNINNDAEQRAMPGKALFDPTAGSQGGVDLVAGSYHEGSFHELDPAEYWYDPRIGYLVLDVPVQDRYVLAVAYITASGEEYGDITFAASSNLVLKLVKSSNQRPDHKTWPLMWRNVYDLGARNVTPDGFGLKIVREVSGSQPDEFQNGEPYIRILGLDRRDKDGRPNPDNLVDLNPWIDLDRGELVFPDLTPFDPTDQQSGLSDRAAVYGSHDQRTLIENSKYVIEVKTQTRQTRFNLGSFGGVVEGSEEVILNGKRLVAGRDYSIDYMTGDVTFRGDVRDEVQSPTADLVINYDTSPLFAFAAQKKSLLGISTSYKFWQNSEIGSLLLYNNQQSPDKRVRVGQEPSRGIVWDGNARFRFKPDFLTRALDALPFISTSAPSRFDISAEVAQSLPNPNTRGEAYIDDFEGSGNLTSLGIFRGQWSRASAPAGRSVSSSGDFIWYNPFEKTPKRGIWPNAEVGARDNTTDILVLQFDPVKTGRGYRGVRDPRREPEPDGPVRDSTPVGPVPGAEIPISERSSAWGGIQRALGGTDLSRSKYIEMWIRGTHGTLTMDLGAISEDVIPNDLLDTEDRMRGGVRDAQLQVDEDIGLDGIPDTGESGFLTAVTPDPNGDDWHYDNRNDYSRINGTEKNKDDGDRGTRPDTEDINNSGFLDRQNSYYSYSIDLGGNDSTFVPGTEFNGWRLFRIPLQHYASRIGRPDSTNIEYARLWMTGVSEKATVEIARMEVVGNDWAEEKDIVFAPDLPPTGDELFDVTVKNTTQNVDYTPPPGVKIQINRVTGVREPEQSLVLKFARIKPGQEVSARRVFLRQENYTDYTRLRMAVAGVPDSTSPWASINETAVELLVRFGADSLNYYDYRTPVFPGWDRRNLVDVDLERFSNIKGWLLRAQADSIRIPDYTGEATVDTVIGGDVYTFVFDDDGGLKELGVRQEDTVYWFPSWRTSRPAALVVPLEIESREPNDKIYRVKGNPAVSTIKTLRIGIRNRGSDQIQGEVWVDELRLDNVRRDPGVKAGVFLDVGLADLIDLGASASWQSERFRDLRSISGAGGSTENVATLRADIKLDNLFPKEWGLSIPASISYDHSSSLPRLRTGSDVVLNPDQKREERSERIRRTSNISFRKSGNNRSSLLARMTLNRVNGSLSLTDETSRSPFRPKNSAMNYSGSFSYDLSPGGRHSLKPLEWASPFLPRWVSGGELHYLPSRLSYSMRLNRSLSEYTDLDRNRRNPRQTRDESFAVSQNYDAKMSPIQSLSFDYKLSTQNDLRDRSRVDLASLRLGQEVDRTQAVDASFNLNTFRWLRQNYSYGSDYHENNDPRLRRRSVSTADTAVVDFGRDVDTKTSASAKWTLTVQSLFESVGIKGVQRESDGMSPITVLHDLAGRLSPLNGSLTRSISLRNSGLLGRPRASYQLGFSNDPGVEALPVSSGISQGDSRSDSDRLNVDSGISLFSGLNTKTKYEYERGRSVTSARSPIHTEKTTFPSISGQWNSAMKIPILSRLAESSSVRFGYEESRSRRGEGSLDPGSLLQDTRDRSFSPLLEWTTSWERKIRTSVRMTKKSSDAKDMRGGKYSGTTLTSNDALVVSADYSLSASSTRNLPLLGRLRSDLNLSLDVTRSADRQEQALGDAAPVLRRDDRVFSVKLDSDYKFSDKFTGGAKIEVANRDNALTQTTRVIREVGFWGEINFN